MPYKGKGDNVIVPKGRNFYNLQRKLGVTASKEEYIAPTGRNNSMIVAPRWGW